MKEQKLAVINDLTSPLFRIMAIQNDLEPQQRQYDNNICAFHIGNGFILSVGHNLRLEATMFKSIAEDRYQSEIAPHLNPAELQHFNQILVPGPAVTGKRYLKIVNQNDVPTFVTALKRINFDTRWVTMYQKQIAKPYLLIQQRGPVFYNDQAVHARFNPLLTFVDPNSNRQSYLIETELIDAWYEDDVALYKIVNTPESIIDTIPRFEIDPEIYDVSNGDYFCVQTAPSDLNPGRMINEANIEGLVDQYTPFKDRFGGNYNLQGLRYLIKGYFRFGSSGAPYIKFDPASYTFKVNAVQTEACPIQLEIKGSRMGNFQFINAIATPLANVIDRINRQMVHG
ncbi:MAG: hypothetical protein D4R64_13785 [Porphyromonadaceae bacterium]|nr:MAG: hypothetical protein D4R64_13785 [Porphyromonadaceae bacterium]